jgi:hypothetical protein
MKTQLIKATLLLGCILLAASTAMHADDRSAKQSEKVGESPRKVALAKVLSGADRLVIEPIPESKEHRPEVIKGVETIKGLIDRIEIDDAKSGALWMAEGGYRFHFYVGDRLVVTLREIEGVALRWENGKWASPPGSFFKAEDAGLTEKAQAAIPLWFKEHGFPDLQERREERLKREKEERIKAERFIACFPERARRFFNSQTGGPTKLEPLDGDFGKRLAAAVGDGETLAVASCRALGTLLDSDSSWSMTGGKEQLVLAAAKTITAEQFLAALNRLKEDRRGLLGAARFYFWEDWRERMPVQSRPEWAVRLAEVVLHDGWDGNKSLVLRWLQYDDSPPVRALLHRVRHGETGKEVDRKTVWFDEPGIRAAATLALVCLNEPIPKEEVAVLLQKSQFKQDKAAYEVCLAFLGDPSFLRREQFLLKSYMIGYAGLEAIERFKGKHGIDVLVLGALHHPWGAVRDEAVKVFNRITGRNWDDRQIELWWEEGADGQNPKPTIKNVGLVKAYREKSGPYFALRPDGRQLAISTLNIIDLHSVSGDSKELQLRGHDGYAEMLSFSTDSKQLYSIGYDKTVRVWDVATGQQSRSRSLNGDSPLFKSSDGKLLSVIQDNGKLMLHDMVDNQEIFKLDVPDKSGFQLDWRISELKNFDVNVNLGRCALTLADGIIHVRDLSSGRDLATIRGKNVSLVRLSPTGRFLLVVESDSIASIWDIAKGTRQCSVTNKIGSMGKLAISADDKYLFVGTRYDSEAGQVWVFDAESGKQLSHFRADVQYIDDFQFSSTGQYVVTTSWSGQIRVWDIAKILGQK